MENLANGLDMGSTPSLGAQGGYSEQPAQRVYSQDEVNAIVQSRLQKKEETLTRMQTEQPQYYAQKYAQNFSPEDSNAMKIAENERIRQLVSDQMSANMQQMQQEFSRTQNEARVNKIVKDFNAKKQEGAKKYADFDEKVNDTSMQHYPYTIKAIVENIDNADDLMYELSNDPMTLAQVEMATKNVSEAAGLAILNKLSKDIKARGAKASEDLQPEVQSFMRKLASSPNVSASHNKAKDMSVDDLKKLLRR